MSDLPLFEVEQGLAGSLRSIPMAVRLRLACAGVKRSLRRCCSFSRDGRVMLPDARRKTPEAIRECRELLRSTPLKPIRPGTDNDSCGPAMRESGRVDEPAGSPTAVRRPRDARPSYGTG
jgi:hypothetical protein